MTAPKNSAKAAKRRIIKYLRENGNYQKSDDELIDLYANTLEDYWHMREDLAGSGYLVEYTNKAGATNLVKNPLAIEMTKTVQSLNNLLKSLGLTPAQRKAIQFGGEPDEFDKFQ